MPAYHVEESIFINKQPAELIAYLSDFTSWPTWSPWLVMEPNCPVSYQGTQGEVGAGYHWQGDLTGEGKMTLKEKSDKELVIDLQFIKPFKSFATATFKIGPEGDGSKVTWLLDAKLPFFLFFMKKMLEQTLSMDYVRGLKMLKSLLETGSIASKMELIGQRLQATMHYIALAGEAKIDGLGELITSDYEKLNALFKERGISPVGAPISLYESMDMETSLCKVRNLFPIAKPVAVEAPFICDSIAESKTYVVKHVGDYQFIGNAWSYAMFSARHNKVKIKKMPAGFEAYLNDPHEVSAEHLETEIVLFVK
ncbi:SRPBCC family protein [Reinekea forsetii]|nr:SRPBCC family protein [Reinekea forsetii]